MPTVTVEKVLLLNEIGRPTMSDDEFDELCFEFGIELDEITSERLEATKSTGGTASTAIIAHLSDTVLYKIDVPANRYDLLCLEGLSRAIKIFVGEMPSPVYKRIDPDNPSTTKITVKKPNTDTIRPYVVGAILRGIDFSDVSNNRYQSFLDLQDQLHRNLCRQRTLVAIGTHDYDNIVGPFTYDAHDPDTIEFIPLTPADRGTFTAKNLLQFYETDVATKHLKPYVPIIKDSPLYPVIYDSNGTVLSLPPIINGSVSKISKSTKNVFIECTGTDLTKTNIVLDTMVTMFCEYCTIPEPYSVEAVTVEYVDESNVVVDSYITPTLSTRREQASVEFCNSLIGIQLSANDMQQLCNKVQLGPAELVDNDTILEVTVPPTRSDILHAVDIAEDIGIAYGYNKIVKKVPTTSTVGGEFPLNHVTDLLRDEIARAGYIEVLTHGLCSIHDNYTALRQQPKIGTEAVTLSNPANIEYQIVRTTLLPGLLKTLQHNKSASFTNGFKLFEISDVVLADSTYVRTETIVGARNERHIAAVYAGPTSGFEIIHGLIDRIMILLEIAPQPDYIANSAKAEEEKFRITRAGWYYTISPTALPESIAPQYFPGRAAAVVVTNPQGETYTVGTFGILHPEVLSNFDIQYPTSSMELLLEKII